MSDELVGCIITWAKDTPVAHLRIGLTDAGIDKLIKHTFPLVLNKDRYWACAIMDYEKDERELYDIPEVRAFCQRLVDRGFIASLHGSTLYVKKEMPHLGRFLGGLEVWAIACNMLDVKGDFDLTKENFADFEAKLRQAEQRAIAIVRPHDGQHRSKA